MPGKVPGAGRAGRLIPQLSNFRGSLHVGGSMAPCSCALSCAHGKTGVRRPAQPARGMPRAHGANGPANPHRPAPDNFPRLLVGVDLGRHVDPRHAWMLFVQVSKYSISMEIHPRMAWIYQISGHRPATPGNTRVCCCFGCCRCFGLGRCRAQPCRTPFTPAVGPARAPVRRYPPPASRHGSTTRGFPDHPLRGRARMTR